MTKEDAVRSYGQGAVDYACEMYETDIGKVLFAEDCRYEDHQPASEEDQVDRCSRASYICAGQ